MLKVVPNGTTLNWHCQGLNVDLVRTKAFTFNSQMSEVIFMSKNGTWVFDQGTGRKGGQRSHLPRRPCQAGGAEAGKWDRGVPSRTTRAGDTAVPSGQLQPDQCLPGPPKPVPMPRALRVASPWHLS